LENYQYDGNFIYLKLEAHRARQFYLFKIRSSSSQATSSGKSPWTTFGYV